MVVSCCVFASPGRSPITGVVHPEIGVAVWPHAPPALLFSAFTGQFPARRSLGLLSRMLSPVMVVEPLCSWAPGSGILYIIGAGHWPRRALLRTWHHSFAKDSVNNKLPKRAMAFAVPSIGGRGPAPSAIGMLFLFET